MGRFLLAHCVVAKTYLGMGFLGKQLYWWISDINSSDNNTNLILIVRWFHLLLHPENTHVDEDWWVFLQVHHFSSYNRL